MKKNVTFSFLWWKKMCRKNRWDLLQLHAKLCQFNPTYRNWWSVAHDIQFTCNILAVFHTVCGVLNVMAKVSGSLRFIMWNVNVTKANSAFRKHNHFYGVVPVNRDSLCALVFFFHSWARMKSGTFSQNWITAIISSYNISTLSKLRTQKIYLA